MVKVRRIADIDTTLRIYYENVEIGNKEIRELYGEQTSSSTLSRLKKVAKDEMLKRGILLQFTPYCVDTVSAFAAWGIDIADLEKRRQKLIKLNLLRTKKEAEEK